VNTRGDRRCDGHANDRLVFSPCYPQHDERAARIKGHRVDNAVGLDGRHRRCAQQPEVQSKVDVLGRDSKTGDLSLNPGFGFGQRQNPGFGFRFGFIANHT